MPFVKGKSGNPGGKTKTYLEIRDLAQKASPTAFRTLKKLAKSAGSETARIQAANSILDRAFGKPPQAHTGEGGQGPILAKLEVAFVSTDRSGDSES
jgi:hypothetical protein